MKTLSNSCRRNLWLSISIACLAMAVSMFASAADEPRTPKGSRPDIDPVCRYNFTSGSANTYLSYCVSDNGNIVTISTPEGHGQELFGGEGYGFCNASPGVVEYHDYAYADSGNWDSPTLLSHTATSVKIARTTSDGIWTLTQTITQVPATPSIKIAMALKNNTAAARGVYLLRFLDADAGLSRTNTLDATQNTAAAWNEQVGSVPFSFGLQLENVGTPQFGYWSGFAQDVPDGPNACAFAFNAPGTAPLVGIDGSIEMVYADTIEAHGTKTATMIYRGF
jgi:hypothetical protein